VARHQAATLRWGAATRKHAIIPERVSPLELLHPDGMTKQTLVVGSNCPAVLLPKSGGAKDELADLVLLAPTVTECRIPGWLEEAVASSFQRLAVDGVAYVLAPLRWRLRIRRLLRQYKLSVGPVIAHIPDWTTNHYLVPLNHIAVTYAFSKLLPVPRWRRALAIIGLRLSSAEYLLGSVLPFVGLVARRPGSRPIFNWLFKLDGEFHVPGNALLSAKWRGQTGTAVLLRFSDNETLPSAVAKIPLMTTGAAAEVDEAAVIDRFGPGARSAGVRVPQSFSASQIGGRPVLLQTALTGHSLASLLVRRPKRVIELMERLVRWLESWNHSTMVMKPLDAARLNRELLAPAALLAPLLEQGEAYREWLATCCAEVGGIAVPLVAAHNDLTMSNILLDEQGTLGVVDWETCRAEAFPLVDFFYATADAVAATRSYKNRTMAFAACFTSDGRYGPAIARLEMRLRDSLVIPAKVADLFFHACWLQHATNEHYLNKPSNRRRFLMIVQWLALHRSRLFRPR
jgi:Phosphotransferase enzyme family